MSSLKGKVAIVTGAASKRGMGHAIALKFANEGADVVVIDKFAAPKSMFPGDENWGGLDEIVGEIDAIGRKALAATVDINMSKENEGIVAKTLIGIGGSRRENLHLTQSLPIQDVSLEGIVLAKATWAGCGRHQ